jgi:hypothetical protein
VPLAKVTQRRITNGLRFAALRRIGVNLERYAKRPTKLVRNGGIRAAVVESINKEKRPLLDFNKCQPIELDDLIRVGNKYDGGYILSKRQIKNTDTVLSFGINLDWTFEEDFFYNKNVKIYSYDYSTKAYLEKNIFGIIYRFFYSSAAILYFLIRGKPARAKNILRIFCLKSNFYKFFNDKQGKHYIPKFIGNYDDDIYTCFETIFNNLGNINNLSVFVKMDVEGAEYDYYAVFRKNQRNGDRIP